MCTQGRIVTESRIIAKHNWATDAAGIAAADEDRGAASTGYDTGGLTTQPSQWTEVRSTKPTPNMDLT